uniref:NADH-ubiquinone oxidoreductase chain 2 n=1 Tax=Amorphoscelis hainana TaxID=2803035 RepID=A0A7U3W1U3_9NEOP|nr:NADH dehydrogenase subunit 2 [Amorphoscelis hainana]QQP01143.1 NADH dehydrogenase subunit 2 [Amorphoscelis hainana]
MPKNSIKILFLMTLISGVLISLSANSWLGAWMGLEINLLSFIPMLTSNKNKFTSEASLKYFLIQAIASATLLFMILMKSNIFEFPSYVSQLNKEIIILPLLMKVASAPFHWWFPSVMEGLSWMNCFLLLSIQKMAPLILISYIISNNFMSQMFIWSSAIIGALGGFNQISFRKILAYSSINHLSWMLTSMILGLNIWFMYFSIYVINILMITKLLSSLNLSFITQMFSSSNFSKSMKIALLISMLSLGGLPPFIGFFPKWIMINFMIQNYFIFTTMILILSSLFTLFYYMRVTYSAFLISTSEIIWMILPSPKSLYSPTMSLTMSLTILGVLAGTLFIMMY